MSWEFLGFSYGFRPKRNQHQALDALAFGIGKRRMNWILDCDVQSFFDKVDQNWLVRFVEHRIGDRRIIRLISKWLTAGVLRWPQEAVMSEAALAIGHGGFGTTMTALAAGVPQLVMPLFAHDQYLNAERIQAVGAGLQLPDGYESIDQVPDAVGRLLGRSPFTEVAQGIAAEIAALPDAAGVVPILAGLRADLRAPTNEDPNGG